MKIKNLLLTFAAAFAVFAANDTQLQAQIIDNLTPFSFTSNPAAINLNGNSLFTGDYDHTGGGVNNYWVLSPNMFGGGFQLGYATLSVKWLTGGPVAEGTSIDSNGTYGGNFGTSTSSFTGAYYGLAYTVSPGNVEYGWAELSFDSSTGTGTIVAAALQTTPNNAIVAGAVPEPSVCAIVGFGALILVISRRKKIAWVGMRTPTRG